MATPVMQRAMGDTFERAHPRLRAQYGITSEDGVAWIGRGVMEEVWHGRAYIAPWLHLGATRRAMFPETGRDVPFTIANYAYRDSFGRETVTWIREFAFPDRTRRFDETFVFSERRGGVVVYVGTHQHLAVDLTVEVGEDGSLVFRTFGQRLYEWRVGIPFPMFFSGRAHGVESFDDGAGVFRIDLSITNRFWGRVFGYRGWFELDRVACGAEDIPADARPVREERRE